MVPGLKELTVILGKHTHTFKLKNNKNQDMIEIKYVINIIVTRGSQKVDRS